MWERFARRCIGKAKWMSIVIPLTALIFCDSWESVTPFGMWSFYYTKQHTALLNKHFSAVPHCSTEDDEYRGYRIPKGTIILPNTWCVTLALFRIYSTDPSVGITQGDAARCELILKSARISTWAMASWKSSFALGEHCVWLRSTVRSVSLASCVIHWNSDFEQGHVPVATGQRIWYAPSYLFFFRYESNSENQIFISVVSILAAFDIERAIGPDGTLAAPNDYYIPNFARWGLLLSR